MYCKFCAGNLGQGNVTRCPKCGLAIDLNDGGQSFFEDIDLITWSQTNEKVESSTPKTELRRVVQQKPQRGVSNAKGKGKQVNKNAFNGKADKPVREVSNEFIIKAGVICTAVVIVFALLILLISQCGNETEGNNGFSGDEPSSIEVISKSEILNLEGVLNYLNDSPDNEEKQDLEELPETNDKPDLPNEIKFEEGNDLENVTIQVLKKSKDMIWFSPEDDSNDAYYVSIDDFINAFGFYNGVSEYTVIKDGKTVLTITVDDDKKICMVSSSQFNDNSQYALQLIGEDNNLHCFDIKLLFHCLGYEFKTDYVIDETENKLRYSDEIENEIIKIMTDEKASQ